MSILAISALSIGLATGAPVTSNDIEYEKPVGLVAEWNFDNGIKLYGGAETGDLAIDNQKDMGVDTYELGAGYQFDFTDTWFMFGGLGYAWTDADDQKFDGIPKSGVLVGDLDDGMTARIGGGFNIGQRWTVNLYYNYFKPDARVVDFDFIEGEAALATDVDMSQIKASLVFNF